MNPATIMTRIAIETELKKGMPGLLRVADLIRNAKDPKWNGWYNDSKQFWTKMGLLDEKGEMHKITREAILAMDL